MKVKANIAAPLLLLLILLLNTGTSLLPDSIIGTGEDRYVTAAFLQIFIIALPAVIFCRLRGEGYTKKLRMRPFGAGHLPVMLFALLFMFFGAALLNFLMHSAFPQAETVRTFSSETGAVGGLYLVLTVAVIPALTEEFLFRGVILCDYESAGVPAAVVMSTLSFAMLHASAVGLPSYILCGAVLAMVLYATRSLLATVVVHMLFNTANLFFGDFIYRVVSAQGTVLFCVALAALALLFAILMLGECERLYTTMGFLPADSSYTGARKRGDGTAGILASLISPTFMMFILFYIIVVAIG